MKQTITLVALCGAALFSTACVSKVGSPVGADLRSAYTLVETRAALTEGDSIPDRYDRSVTALMEDPEGFSDDYEARMAAHAGGELPADGRGEALLTFLIADQTNGRVASGFTGERPARLDVEVVSTTFPNAATMMLVGEVISLGYTFELVDVETGQALVQSNEPIYPIIERSAGVGGGLLGLALRGGGEGRHLLDLENMADATAQELAAILLGGMIFPRDEEKIEVYDPPVSAASTEAEEALAHEAMPASTSR
jgi:hypothetical protein